MKDAIIDKTLSELYLDFEYIESWEERYHYLIDLGKNLPPLSSLERIESNIVRGCMSQVWLCYDTFHDGEGDLAFRLRAQSDAIIVNGLIAILLIILDKRKVCDIVSLDIELIFNKLGLLSHLSSQRSNGLRSMILHIQSKAELELGVNLNSKPS